MQNQKICVTAQKKNSGSVSNVGVDKKEKSCNKFKNFQFKKQERIRFSFLIGQNVGSHKKFFSRL